MRQLFSLNFLLELHWRMFFHPSKVAIFQQCSRTIPAEVEPEEINKPSFVSKVIIIPMSLAQGRSKEGKKEARPIPSSRGGRDRNTLKDTKNFKPKYWCAEDRCELNPSDKPQG